MVVEDMRDTIQQITLQMINSIINLPATRQIVLMTLLVRVSVGIFADNHGPHILHE